MVWGSGGRQSALPRRVLAPAAQARAAAAAAKRRLWGRVPRGMLLLRAGIGEGTWRRRGTLCIDSLMPLRGLAAWSSGLPPRCTPSIVMTERVTRRPPHTCVCLQVITSEIDDGLNDECLIVPGCGNFGDR